MKQLKLAFLAVAALVAANLGLAELPTPEQAVKHAKSVVLVKQVIRDNQIHSYVKEVWRSGPDATTPPPVGSEYGRPHPYRPSMRFPECDAIVFDFGADRVSALPNILRIVVNEERRVPFFLEAVAVRDDAGTIKRITEEPMTADEVRRKIKKTKLQSG
jgi:hypothetical protein